MTNIQRSTNAYENWLRAELGDEIVEKDLDRKHEKMRDNPFAFLRAAYWRWAETALVSNQAISSGMGLSDEHCSPENCATIQRLLIVPEPVQRRPAHLCSSESGRRPMARQTKSPRCHKACELAPTQSVPLLSASEDLPPFSADLDARLGRRCHVLRTRA
jgi:hypothetical protein